MRRFELGLLVLVLFGPGGVTGITAHAAEQNQGESTANSIACQVEQRPFSPNPLKRNDRQHHP